MAKFSKPHYILIANALLRAKAAILQSEEGESLMGLSYVVDEIALTFRNDNRKFDSSHFLAVIRGEKPANSRPSSSTNNPNRK